MNYIPYVLATEFIDNYDSSSGYSLNSLELCFMDKRKFNKQRATKAILNQIYPYDVRKTVTTSKVEVKNSGFILELQENYCNILVHHSEFPETDYSIVKVINADNYFQLFKLLGDVGEMRGRKLAGTYYFNPNINFFELENKLDKDYIEGAKLGKLLSGSWKKLIPGHKYYIEIGPSILSLKEVVFLGTIKDTKISDRCYNRHSYVTNYLSNGFDISNEYYTVKLAKEIYLFKDLALGNSENSYFICSKSDIRGIDLGDTGEIVSETEFYDLAVKNSWLIYISDKELFKRAYAEELKKIIDIEGPKLTQSYRGSTVTINLNYDTIDKVVDIVFEKGSSNGWRYTGKLTPFTRILAPNEFNLDKKDLKDILSIVYSHYGWKEG